MTVLFSWELVCYRDGGVGDLEKRKKQSNSFQMSSDTKGFVRNLCFVSDF